MTPKKTARKDCPLVATTGGLDCEQLYLAEVHLLLAVTRMEPVAVRFSAVGAAKHWDYSQQGWLERLEGIA